MTDASQETHPLPYAGPATRLPRSSRFGVLAAINGLAAVARLWFVPLATHVYSCTHGQKWCHMQALVLGIPSALVWVVLLAVTATMTLASAPTADRSDGWRTATWLLLTFPALVLLALFVAVAHNSK